MSITKYVAILMIFAGIYTATLSTAQASISAPLSSGTVSDDGKHILIMKSPYPADDYRPEITLPDSRVVNIHKAFAKSGVYDLPSLKPLWQVDWWDHEWVLTRSPDMRYVVRLNRFALKTGDALTFYDAGKVIKSYSCAELLPSMRSRYFLPFETSDWYMRWFERIDLVPGTFEVRVETARRGFYFFDGWRDLGRQEFYSFDLRTGAMISSKVTGAWWPWVYLGIAITIVLTLGYLAIRLFIVGIRILRRRKGPGFPIEETVKSR